MSTNNVEKVLLMPVSKHYSNLNQLGYSQENPQLILNLVFNPQDATLPPDQQTLEQSYKHYLLEDHGIVFNQLFAMSNLPVQRFGSQLISKGLFNDYMQLLKDHYQAQNLTQVMCKNTLSVDWQGYVYDCDFNQMLHLPLAGKKSHLKDVVEIDGDPITTLEHCYGCTAGQGSSCGGAIN